MSFLRKSFFWTSFWIRLKLACTVSFLLVALLVPAAIMALGAIFGGGNLSIQVGVYGDLNVQDAIRYNDRERMRQDVANRRLELAYAAEEDGEEGLITLYVSPATVTDRVINLLVAAGYLESIAGEIGARILPSELQADENELQARVDEILADGPLMDRVVVIYGQEYPAQAEGQTGPAPFRRLFHGMLALFGQLLAMLCALGLTGQDEREVGNRLKAVKKNKVYTLAGAAVVFALTGLIMLAVILLGLWAFPSTWVRSDALPFLIYLLVITFISFILAIKLPDGVYPAILVLAFIFTALMGGVIFDLREVFYSVGFLRYLFPSYYYMGVTMRFH